MKDEMERAQTPEEKYQAAALELAVYRLLKQENNSVEERMNEEAAAELAQAVEESTPRILKRIDKQLGRAKIFNHFWKRNLPFVKAAALFVLVLNMGFTIANQNNALVYRVSAGRNISVISFVYSKAAFAKSQDFREKLSIDTFLMGRDFYDSAWSYFQAWYYGHIDDVELIRNMQYLFGIAGGIR